MTNVWTGSRRRGSALIEVLLAAMLLATLMGLTITVGTSSRRAYRSGTLSTSLQGRMSFVANRITTELMAASTDSIQAVSTAPQWDPTITFERIESVDTATGAVTWTTDRIGVEYATGETNDGTDENENGLIDDCVVVLVRDVGTANEQRVVLCTGVGEYLEGEAFNGADDNGNVLRDEQGLCFERRGDALVVRISLQGMTDTDELMELTHETSIWVRNGSAP
ncbi:MAG: hypothetical protein GY711_17995 [bacterium]|nr:hypothetical protein [bacterium]